MSESEPEGSRMGEPRECERMWPRFGPGLWRCRGRSVAKRGQICGDAGADLWRSKGRCGVESTAVGGKNSLESVTTLKRNRGETNRVI